jgi:hypothetical protein
VGKLWNALDRSLALNGETGRSLLRCFVNHKITAKLLGRTFHLLNIP